MRIGFTGTISAGKTTLVNALKELPEFKDYYFATERSKYLRDLGIPLNTDSTLKGQTIFLAERCSELMRENVITDRTIIDVMAFTHCAGSINGLDKEEFIKYFYNKVNEIITPEYKVKPHVIYGDSVTGDTPILLLGESNQIEIKLK